jgi:hydrogenase nickel incorporation protein HypA/HybF
MHEIGLVENAIKKAISVMETAGATSIERLTFGVAQGGHVTSETIETLFFVLSAGTPAESARLEFEALDTEYGCWACGRTFNADDDPAGCPSCGSAAVKALPGSDLVLRYVDVAQVPDVHAGRGARTDHLRGELARAARRRANFTSR